MSASVTGTSTCSSNNRIEAHELSYSEVTVLSSGGIISKEMKVDLRKQLGYCLTCPHVPVLLIEIRRSRINPLWISKKPRTEDGECVDGRCLRCSPKRDASYGTVVPMVETSRNVQLTRTLSVASSISSCSIGSNTNPLVSVTGTDFTNNHHGQFLSSRMLPPRTPSRSSSGSTAGFYGSSSRQTSPSYYGSRIDSPTREISRGRSSVNSRENVDCEPHESQRERTSRSFNSTYVESQNSKLTARQPTSTKSLAETRNDVSDKTSEHIVPNMSSNSSKVVLIQEMLKEMRVVGNDIFIECLLTVMESNRSDQHVQIYCLTTIREELDEDDDGTMNDSVIAMNGTSKILDAMTTFPSSVPVQEIGCTTLLTLASYDENRISLIESAACKILRQTIEVNCRESSIVEPSFSTLRILSTEIEGRNSMLTLNTSSAVVASMQCNLSYASIQQDGCAILSNLAVDVARNAVTSVGKDEIAVIVEAMQVHSNDETVMASASFALKNFAYNSLNLRAMNRTSNILEALEDAALFESLSISASQTSEKLYLSQAEDESLVDHAYKVLMKTISKQSDDPEIMVVIIQSLREFKWSSIHVAACLKKLKPLALTSQPHLIAFLESMSLKELLDLNNEFHNAETIKSEVAILARMYDNTSD